MSQWPVQLQHGDVQLRPLKLSDRTQWSELRTRNVEWLRKWDATLPMADESVPVTFGAMVRLLRKEAKAGRSLSFAILYQGVLAGQITLGGISYGSLRAANIGYWIDERVAGRGIMPTAVALVGDYAIAVLRLHRIEINLRPENEASRRVVDKLGFQYEGRRVAYLHIDGDWRDHDCYVMTSTTAEPALMAALSSRRLKGT